MRLILGVLPQVRLNERAHRHNPVATRHRIIQHMPRNTTAQTLTPILRIHNRVRKRRHTPTTPERRHPHHRVTIAKLKPVLTLKQNKLKTATTRIHSHDHIQPPTPPLTPRRTKTPHTPTVSAEPPTEKQEKRAQDAPRQRNPKHATTVGWTP